MHGVTTLRMMTVLVLLSFSRDALAQYIWVQERTRRFNYLTERYEARVVDRTEPHPSVLTEPGGTEAGLKFFYLISCVSVLACCYKGAVAWISCLAGRAYNACELCTIPFCCCLCCCLLCRHEKCQKCCERLQNSSSGEERLLDHGVSPQVSDV